MKPGNFETTILDKTFGTKQSKTGQIKKSLISTLCVFGQLLPKFNLWKGNWALGYVSTQI